MARIFGTTERRLPDSKNQPFNVHLDLLCSICRLLFLICWNKYFVGFKSFWHKLNVSLGEHLNTFEFGYAVWHCFLGPKWSGFSGLKRDPHWRFRINPLEFTWVCRPSVDFYFLFLSLCPLFLGSGTFGFTCWISGSPRPNNLLRSNRSKYNL